MAYLKCTQKILTKLGITSAEKVADDVPVGRSLGSWYVNSIILNRRTAVLFVNERTYYSLLVPGMTKARFADIANVFRQALSRALAGEGYSGATIAAIMNEYATLDMARTSSRRILGTMNEYALMYRVEPAIDADQAVVDAAIRKMNRIILGACDYRYSSDLLFELWPLDGADAPRPKSNGRRSQPSDPEIAAFFATVREQYAEDGETPPGIKQDWVESWLQEKAAAGSTAVDLASFFDDIFAFSSYFERSEHVTPDKMPWWEYSVMLEWIDSHFLVPERYDLTLTNARRILGTLREFLQYLATRHEIANSGGIDEAWRRICAGRTLALVREIPYAGTEFWTAVYPPGKDGVAFRIVDFWLILLYVEHGKNWNGVRLTLKAARDHREKQGQLADLLHRLSIIGYDNPLALLHEDVYQHEVDAAWRWLRGEKQG